MADITVIRTALANQLNTYTGLRAEAEVKDQVSPPMILVVPSIPPIVYGATMSGGGETEVTVNLAIMLLLSDAPPTEKVQRALDSYLGVGSGQEVSIPSAITADPRLGGIVEWCIPVSVTQYGRVEYGLVNYFGGTVTCQIGAG